MKIRLPKQISLKARAKINLTIDVLYKRKGDRYHEIETVMQQISLGDLLHFKLRSKGIKLHCTDSDLPSGEENLAFKAALLLKQIKPDGGVEITIEKNIPVAAGLAGGSSDAAMALVALNHLWELRLSEEELCSLGARLGSDVPFCIKGGTAVARGRGERLTFLPPAPNFWVVLVKPGALKISTGEVYAALGKDDMGCRFTKRMLEALDRGSKSDIKTSLGNALEEAVFSRWPEVVKLKEIILSQLGERSLMSGSGPTVFILVPELAKAEAAGSLLRCLGYETWLTSFYDHGKGKMKGMGTDGCFDFGRKR